MNKDLREGLEKNLPLQPQSHMACDKMGILLLNCLVHLIFCLALTCDSVVCATTQREESLKLHIENGPDFKRQLLMKPIN